MFKNEGANNIKRMTASKEEEPTSLYTVGERIAYEHFKSLLDTTFESIRERRFEKIDNNVLLLLIALDAVPIADLTQPEIDRIKQKLLRQRDAIRAVKDDATYGVMSNIPRRIEDFAVLNRCFPQAHVALTKDDLKKIRKILGRLHGSIEVDDYAEAFIFGKIVEPDVVVSRDPSRYIQARFEQTLRFATEGAIAAETHLSELARYVLCYKLMGLKMPDEVSPSIWRKCFARIEHEPATMKLARTTAILLMALAPDVTIKEDGIHVSKPESKLTTSTAPMPTARNL